MMVKQTKHIIGLGDIRVVRIQCEKCKAELIQALDEAAIPVSCPAPGCDERWTPNGSSTYSVAVIESIRKAQRFGDPKFTLRFEVDGEKA